MDKKNIWRKLTVREYFRPVAKIGPKPRKTLATVKVTAVVLSSHFRELLIVIFRRITCNQE